MMECQTNDKMHTECSSDEVIVRDYTPSDFPGLYRLLSTVYQSTVTKAELECHYVAPEKEILLAFRDTQLAGCAFLSYNTDYIRRSHTVFVTYVAVDESVRHCGIGRILFSEIEKRARSRGCTAVELTSADSRTVAHAFYQALNFTKKKTTVFIKELG